MINQDLLHTLAYNALNNHRLNPNPDQFAQESAILITYDFASKESRETASEATFMSALAFASKTGVATHWISLDMVKRQNKAMDEWKNMSEQLQKLPVYQTANTLFLQATGDNYEKHQRAKIAADAHYAFVYATCLCAYLYAVSMAARPSLSLLSLKDKDEVFKKAFIDELKRTLLCKPIEPAFLMKALTSDAALYLSALGILGGFIALSTGMVFLAAPSAGLMLASGAGVGVAASIAVGGGAAAVVSLACMAGRFFAKKAITIEDRKSEKAVENLLQRSVEHNAL